MYNEPTGMDAVVEWATVLESVKYRRSVIEHYAFCAIREKVAYSLIYLRNKEQCSKTLAYIKELESLGPLIGQIAQGYWEGLQ